MTASRVSPSRYHGWQLLTFTAFTPGPTVIVAGPLTMLLSAMSRVLVDLSRKK
jgi:hypothetical protein